MTFNAEAARALLAGFIAGAAVGLFSSPVVLLAILRSPRWRDRGEGGISPVALGLVVANGLLFAWTLAGLVLGAVYLGAPQPQFSLTVAVVLLGLVGGAAFVWRRVTWPVWAMALLAVAAFGGLLPFLASRG